MSARDGLEKDDESSSSDSTVPPSEATLADEPIDQPHGPRRIIYSSVQSQPQPEDRPGPPDISWLAGERMKAISTSCESFVSDIVESSSIYEIGRHANAECALLAYSRTNDINRLQTLLESKKENKLNFNLNHKGNQKQNYSWSALHLACYFGHEQVVELLLSEKKFREELDINIRNSSGDTPLHKAALTNRVRIVQLFLSHGANVCIKNCDGLLAKQLATDKHIFDMLEASEQADRNTLKQNMFKAVDNGDLRKLQEYFREYNSLCDTPELALIATETNGDRSDPASGSSELHNSVCPFSSQVERDAVFPRTEFINQVIDERGNTLLHLAAMRGFKAICVYLLEQGCDPYKKNNLGQTCIELSSYQLRQLFMSVKPATGRLKRLTKERVTRFEGPLLRKIRILGWKQMYVVLENGVFLLFNNCRDSMNRSRRGYKYLESAVCEPDPYDLGMFTVRFSDNSRATFLISSSHLSYYTTFKLPPSNNNNDMIARSHSSTNSTACQIELVRQKWIDSMRDHIAYSTEFIRKGLKVDDDDNEYESMNYDGGSLANLKHLLPLDTIKSFNQEARAHYSIFERHAESLCNLTQSIMFAQQQALASSFEVGRSANQQPARAAGKYVPPVSQAQWQANEADNQSNVATTTTTSTATTQTTGSRLLGLIRPNRQQARTSLADEEDVARAMMNHSIMRARNSATSEFVQDNWPCLLFHLRLLMESAENTKTSMGQALALMEHQEQLRQNRIQDQEERCRVLEDSLQTLARDHHELEKSLSMSQIYHSACRSISMSTDLNEYHDAFEDFDDEKTMTPNSLPSDEELDQRIRDIMELEGSDRTLKNHTYSPGANGPSREDINNSVANLPDDDINDEEDDGEDLQSNCSALTVETVAEQYQSAADVSLCHASTNELDQAKNRFGRARLPAPMIPRDQVSIWSILKNCIGKELSKITMPVVFNEPLTMLQRSCEGLQYSKYLDMADQSDDPIERMELVCAFIVAALSGNSLRIVKPFNPLLYETFEIEHESELGVQVRGLSQQVSHHPPITAAYAESKYFSYNGVINPKIKFWGRSVEVSHDGACRVHLKYHNESYLFKAVACSIHNIIVGKLWFEHHGPLDVRCAETSMQANLVFKQAGWFNNDLHRFEGFISSGDDIKRANKLRFVYGKWSDYIKSVHYADYENYIKQQKLFRIPDKPDNGDNTIVSASRNLSLSGSPNSVNNNSIPNMEKLSDKATSSAPGSGNRSCDQKSESNQFIDIPNSRTLWKLDTQFLSEYYNFSLFTMKLNELTPELEQSLPRTDSRFRPDVRKLEEGDLDGAANEKNRLEEKQREARAKDSRFKDPSPDMLWFELQDVPNMKEKLYVYKGGYWENKSYPKLFPSLF